MQLPQARDGEVLNVTKHPVPFSFWPAKKTTKRSVVNTRVFVSNPWPNIRRCIKDTRITAKAKREALAYCEQSEDFFYAAQVAKLTAAKPLLLYYGFMNLAKAYVLKKKIRPELSSAYHGLISLPVTLNTLPSAKIKAFRGNGNLKFNLFDGFFEALFGEGIAEKEVVYKMDALLPQVITGHRLWVDAKNSKSRKPHKERFVALKNLDYMHCKSSKELWLKIAIAPSDLNRANLGITNFTNLSGRGLLRAVRNNDGDTHILESVNSVKHKGSPLDYLPMVSSDIRRDIWKTIRTDMPYRKYYFYVCPKNEVKQLLPQILSIYTIMFYLGSVTRYQPARFDKIMDSKYSSFVESFINDQPAQFLYQMASCFEERDVAKAAII